MYKASEEKKCTLKYFCCISKAKGIIRYFPYFNEFSFNKKNFVIGDVTRSSFRKESTRRSKCYSLAVESTTRKSADSTM